ncbi:sensor histidine kinase [Paenibacillus sp. NRS-1782]|uniref:sensor histidine kinase n=3 Tax=Paenibacillus TaxID=44249 RepID=UPI003D2A6892
MYGKLDASLSGWTLVKKIPNRTLYLRAMSNDEIGVLSRRFRQMMDTINNLILQEYKLELANETHQLKALQEQINPHFLYNTHSLSERWLYSMRCRESIPCSLPLPKCSVITCGIIRSLPSRKRPSM